MAKCRTQNHCPFFKPENDDLLGHRSERMVVHCARLLAATEAGQHL